jgi:hypothetical protein
MPCDVFMSYTRLKDIDGNVTDLRAHLQKRLREETKRDIRIFQDTEIEAGARWKAALRDEIRSARIFLLLLSPNWLNSQYCNIEFELALSGDKWIVPLLWEQTSNDLSQKQKDILSQVSERQILIADIPGRQLGEAQRNPGRSLGKTGRSAQAEVDDSRFRAPL